MAVFWIAQIYPFTPVDPTNSSLCGTAGCVLLLELFLIESAETYWCRYPAGIKTRTNIMDFYESGSPRPVFTSCNEAQ